MHFQYKPVPWYVLEYHLYHFPNQTPISPICHTPLFAISQNLIPFFRLSWWKVRRASRATGDGRISVSSEEAEGVSAEVVSTERASPEMVSAEMESAEGVSAEMVSAEMVDRTNGVSLP